MPTPCSECPSEIIYALGKCRRCYQRQYARERSQAARGYTITWTSAADGHKVCRKCEKEKPVSEFSPRAAGKDGLQAQCRRCIADRKNARRAANPTAREKERAYERKPEVKAKIRAGRASRLYGISIAEYMELHRRQDGRCATCRRKRRLALDHCHASTRVRELLCHRCNVILGLANDDVDLLKVLINYIEQHSLLGSTLSSS